MKRVSIITGATSGIGLEISKLIAKENTDIVLVSRNEQKLINTKKELEEISNNNISYIVADLSLNEDEYIDRIKEEVKDKCLLYLINNAGFGDFGEFKNADIEKQNKMINLNIITLTKISKLYFELVENQNYDSYLLNVASVAGYMPGPLMSVYYATKAYVLSFTRAIRFENRKDSKIHISILCPGATDTGFVKASSLENSGLFNNLKIMSAKKVAKIAMSGLKKGKKEIITGGVNKMSIFMLNFVPNVLIEKVVYMIMKRKK